MIDERPIKVIFYVLMIFSFIAYISLCIYSEFVDVNNSIDRYFLTTIISIIFGSFMKALHTYTIELIIGFNTTYPSETLILSKIFKHFSNLGIGFTIMYTFFAMSIEGFLGFLTLIIIFIAIGIILYALKNVQR